MLACARIGAPHNVVFGGFSPSAVRERMEVSRARALITTDGARRRGRTAPIKQAVDDEIGDLDTLETVIVVRSTGVPCPMRDGRDYWYEQLLAEAEPECPAEPMEAEHPLFLLYSSGSTAKPKGIVHSTGGYLAGVATTMAMVFDLDAERDVFWCTADVGWITGHSYIVYGPMANGATSVMYEGTPDYPDKDAWWNLVEKEQVSIFYTAPTAIRSAMKWGEEYPARHDLSSLRLLGTVGEPINPKAWLWYYAVVGGERCPVVDTWWQTETGAIMIAPLPALTATKPGSATLPLPGVSATLYDEKGDEITEGDGLLVLTQPWPSMLRTLFNDPDRYVQTYFSRFGPRTYFVGDGARRDEDGYFWITGRVDDVINVSGHRLSTAEIESALVAHAVVAEAAVIAVTDEMSGQAVIAYVTVVGEAEPGPDLATELRDYVGTRIGKLARPRRIIWSPELPKTRSGRSCAGCCATSRRAAISVTSPPWLTRRSCRLCRRRPERGVSHDVSTRDTRRRAARAPDHSDDGVVAHRVALVTGGTRGIGAAVSRALAQEGASVAAGTGTTRRPPRSSPPSCGPTIPGRSSPRTRATSVSPTTAAAWSTRSSSSTRGSTSWSTTPGSRSTRSPPR